MDMQWGADGSFYLLTYGDGFFAPNADAGLYRWDYVKGQRAPTAVLTTDRTDGPLPLTVNFSSAGSSDRSRRLAQLRLGLRRRQRALDAIRTRATSTRRGPLHGRPDGHGHVRQQRHGEHHHHGR